MKAKDRLNRNSDAALRTTFKYSKCFQRSKQKLYNYFSLTKGCTEFKNNLPIYIKYWLINRPSKKIFVWWPSPFKPKKLTKKIFPLFVYSILFGVSFQNYIAQFRYIFECQVQKGGEVPLHGLRMQSRGKEHNKDYSILFYSTYCTWDDWLWALLYKYWSMLDLL